MESSLEHDYEKDLRSSPAEVDSTGGNECSMVCWYCMGDFVEHL